MAEQNFGHNNSRTQQDAIRFAAVAAGSCALVIAGTLAAMRSRRVCHGMMRLQERAGKVVADAKQEVSEFVAFLCSDDFSDLDN